LQVQGTTRGGPAFELDRFGLVDGDRYEVEGRWSGVRGRLFIRPQLTLTNSNQSQRLLADLAQKPWQTADGEAWTVAFPCSDDPIEATEVELTVAPDITVSVKRGRARGTRAKRDGVARERPAPSKESPKPPARAEAEAKTGGKRRGLGVRLAEAQSELEQVREERAHLVDRLAAATRRAEEARAERERVAQSRDQLADKLDQAVTERDTATRVAAVDREAAQSTQDELEQSRNALEQALETLNQTAAERDSAIRAGVEVERELHAARAASEDLINARERLVSQQNWLRAELKRIVAEQDPARDEPEQPPAAHRNLVAPRQVPLPASNGDDEWIVDAGARFSTGATPHTRAMALGALAVAIVVVLLIVLLLVF
jgi:hypothetical protein